MLGLKRLAFWMVEGACIACLSRSNLAARRQSRKPRCSSAFVPRKEETAEPWNGMKRAAVCARQRPKVSSLGRASTGIC
ncbi:hypothetical protein B0T19DRAFT_422734 [Cercophora scortea]|uniref:Uncharacterized protein n=1 Tax=Cercophora scortea TaxID=314031 RepID=A0AAE0IML3_9PEZI|nr:hypothetical protein B0T19DRAFT_422734 [Cercophora scortea]